MEYKFYLKRGTKQVHAFIGDVDLKVYKLLSDNELDKLLIPKNDE